MKNIIFIIFFSSSCCLFSQAKKDFVLNKVDSIKNDYVIRAFDVLTKVEVAILVDINLKNRNIVNCYRKGDSLSLFVYKVSVDIIISDSLAPLKYEGEELITGLSNNCYYTNEIPNCKTQIDNQKKRRLFKRCK